MPDGSQTTPALSATLIGNIARVPTSRTLHDADGLVIKHHVIPSFCTAGVVQSVTICLDGTEIEIVGSDMVAVHAAFGKLLGAH